MASRWFQPDANTRFSRVCLALSGFVAVSLVVLTGRVAQLQLAPGERLQEQMRPRLSSSPDVELRGDILDRRGRLLATTRIARRVVIDPTIFGAQEPLDQAIARLAQAMGQPVQEVDARVRWALAENVRRAELAARWTPELAAQLAAEEAARTQPPADASAATPAGAAAPSAPTDAPAVPPLGENDPFTLKAQQALTAVPTENGPQAASDDASAEQGKKLPGPPKPIRYLPFRDVLTQAQEDALRAQLARRKKGSIEPPALRGVVLEKVPQRELVAGAEAAALVGSVGFEGEGQGGAEYRLTDELAGRPGKLIYFRDRSGRPLWVEEGFVVPAQPGQSVRLSIDLELQRIAHEELTRQVTELNAAGGRLVMVDPNTGELLAMVDIVRDLPDATPVPALPAGAPNEQRMELDPGTRWRVLEADPLRALHPALAKNRNVVDVYEPGSTFKPFVWAVVTELGKARLTEVFDTHGGRWTAPDGRYLEDVTRRNTMTWPDVLVNSSNIGMVQAGQRLSFQEMHDAIRRFGFGSRTNIGLAGESGGMVTPMSRWKNFTQVSVSYGHEVAVTPLQMVRAFSTFAREGERSGTLPTLRLTATSSDEAAPVTFRVLPEQVATVTRYTMQGVTDVVDARWMKDETPDGGWRYSLFGKSGTAKIPVPPAPKGYVRPKGVRGYFDNQFISSFIAGGPVENPRLVILVTIDDPARAEGRARAARFGSAAAGPVVRRVMERSLTYLGAPASPPSQMQGAPLASAPQ